LNTACDHAYATLYVREFEKMEIESCEEWAYAHDAALVAAKERRDEYTRRMGFRGGDTGTGRVELREQLESD